MFMSLLRPRAAAAPTAMPADASPAPVAAPPASEAVPAYYDPLPASPATPRPQTALEQMYAYYEAA
ncbi:hypothetical protein [Frigidibacter oleivorans]|uniref:hypothetical protein n=1 Tax=Frigidibacter oleivorans TaxID=2487129 RepID=UPI000F8F0EBF|nr:hypothetical protein [Frigidibacter oleivorans]